jgi:hypothetical protein
MDEDAIQKVNFGIKEALKAPRLVVKELSSSIIIYIHED